MISATRPSSRPISSPIVDWSGASVYPATRSGNPCRGRRHGEHQLSAPPISDYALLGDCQGAALASRGGSIDWWCAPRFDSPSTLGRLLDPDAGHWSLRPSGPFEATRRYLPDTMVLETVFTTAAGRAVLTEALALEAGAREHEIGIPSPHALLRAVRVTEGEVALEMELVPRPEYGLVTPAFEAVEGGARTVGGPDLLELRTELPLALEDGRASGAATLRAGESVAMALAHRHGSGPDPAAIDAAAALADTVEAWRSWAALHRGYDGYATGRVRRGAMVLQALTYAPTGAIVAAATTSLPEVVGGEDNYDYRFAWLRDASLTLGALWIAACPDEAERNFRWMAGAAVGAERSGEVQVVFGVEGERDLTERELDHLRGYRDSRPVRVGNAAWRQTQLDVPGEVIASAHLLREQLGELDPALARFLRAVADIAARRWQETDSGIWEGREGERHYLTSKLFCWAGLDRAVRMAQQLGADGARAAGWAAERDAVRAAILEEGWSERAGAYTGAFGSDHLDASVLLMPLVGFVPAGEERMLRTIAAIERDLVTDGLVHRWTGAGDGGFIACSFWLADCLARAGDVERAIEVVEAIAARANDVGLMSEEVDPADGALIGNFPQGFAHIALITAAASIDRARRDGAF